MKIVKLLNPNDIPFGKLSNNSFHNMEIDGIIYNTVTNYIYSNMLITPLYKIMIRNAKIQTVPKNMNNNLLNTINFLIKSRETKDANDKPVVPIKFSKRKNIQKEGEENYRYQDINIKDIVFPEDNSVTDIKKKQTELSNQVGIPFEKIDLLKLKQEVEDDEIIARSGIFNEFNKYQVLEISSVLKEATEKGFLARFEDLEFAELLLQTGNVPIRYDSEDELLGTGLDGKGTNIVGQVLEQLRHMFQLKRTELLESKKMSKLYVIYKAYLGLLNIMKNENEDVLQYDNLPVDMILSKYFSNELHSESLMPTLDEFSRAVRNSTIVLSPVIYAVMKNPNNLVKYIRRENIDLIKTIRDAQIDRKEDLIFQIYLEHMVLRNFEELSPEDNKKAVQQQLLNISTDEKNKLKKRVIAIYMKGKGEFSDELLGKIDKEIKKFKVISDEEIEAILSQKVENVSEDNVLQDEDEYESVLNELSEVSSARSENDKIMSLEQTFKMDKNSDEENKKVSKNKQKLTDFEKSVLVVKLVSQLINITGNPFIMYKDMSIKELQETLRDAKSKSFVSQSQNKSDAFIVPTGHPLIIYKDVNKNMKEFVHLCPEFFNKMLTIESFAYPTIQHYVIARIISVFTGITKSVNKEGRTVIERGMTMIEAITNILSDSGKTVINKIPENTLLMQNPYYFSRPLVPSDFTTIEHAENVYKHERFRVNEFQLGWLTSIGLNAKFQDEDLQNLLLITGVAELRWMSPESLFLGYGNNLKKGNNYVGKVLMEIRENVIRKHNRPNSFDTAVFINKKNIIEFIETDPIVKQWILVRVSEICDIIKTFQNLIKFDIIDDKYENFIKVVINNIYKNTTGENPMSPVPTFVLTRIKECQTLTYSEYDNEYNEKLIELYDELETLENRKKIAYQSNEEILEFKKAQEEEYEAFIKLKHTKKEISDFLKQQNKDRAEFQEMIKGNNTTESDIQEKKKEIAEHKRNASKRKVKETTVINTIAYTCWNKILMLVDNLLEGYSPSRDTIRQVLTNTLLPVFQKCKKIVQNNPLNCTVSALLNILTGMKKLKTDFPDKFDSKKLEINDIDIAGSIILKSTIVPLKRTGKNRNKNSRFGFGEFSDDEDHPDDRNEVDDEDNQEEDNKFEDVIVYNEETNVSYNPEENHPAYFPISPTYMDDDEEKQTHIQDEGVSKKDDIESIKRELSLIDNELTPEETNNLGKHLFEKAKTIHKSPNYLKRLTVNFYSTEAEDKNEI
jgi:predicted NAD-dependent protein-ADP-ribosyltransferase YbiA (DUF1768 family)